jgi:asparagine synthase (glutamine-hydrolysing)
MCGIVGIVHGGSPALLEGMRETMQHRGPDDQGLVWFDDVLTGLANRRLSILDLSSRGHQPMSTDDGRFWIVHSGEVYNHKELASQLEARGATLRSSSDTEVILRLFEQKGDECLKQMNGMFAFAIYDRVADELFLVRDRLGVKPLYYASIPQGLLFASEIKAILASGLVDKLPDYHAMNTPTRFQIPPYTGFKNIFKLPPGHCLRFCKGKINLTRYWTLDPTEAFSGREEEAAEFLEELLKDAVKLQLTADVPVGLLISGGLDSSLISALVRRMSRSEIESFTTTFSRRDRQFEQMPDDGDYARKLARQLNLIHHERELEPNITDLLPKMIWHLDEPLSDPAAINLYLLCEMARTHGIKVVLTGMGGDEVFGGYRKYLACLRAEAYAELVPSFVRSGIESVIKTLPVATRTRGLRRFRWMKRFASIASLPPLERYLSSDLSLTPGQYRSLVPSGLRYESTHFFTTQAHSFHHNGGSYLTRMCKNDTRFFLPEHNLTYSDKAGMAASVETRPPLTDHRVVEFMFRLPPEFRIRRGIQKYLLRKIARRYLPMAFVERSKTPFGSPLRSWIRGPLREMILDLLSEQSIRNRGLYDAAYVRQLIVRNQKGLDDNAHVIWTLLCNELWLRTFFDCQLKGH